MVDSELFIAILIIIKYVIHYGWISLSVKRKHPIQNQLQRFISYLFKRIIGSTYQPFGLPDLITYRRNIDGVGRIGREEGRLSNRSRIMKRMIQSI